MTGAGHRPGHAHRFERASGAVRREGGAPRRPRPQARGAEPARVPAFPTSRRLCAGAAAAEPEFGAVFGWAGPQRLDAEVPPGPRLRAGHVCWGLRVSRGRARPRGCGRTGADGERRRPRGVAGGRRRALGPGRAAGPARAGARGRRSASAGRCRRGREGPAGWAARRARSRGRRAGPPLAPPLAPGGSPQRRADRGWEISSGNHSFLKDIAKWTK